ncbi:MAG: hypothetical protein GY937_24005 [bacterium]|nr:hypothetical protein [bacterium]
MAKAWLARGKRGELIIHAKGRIGDQVLRRQKRVPDDDPELGDEMIRQLNRDFLMSNFSWLTRAAERADIGPIPRRRRGPVFSEWADRWLEDLKGEIEESTRRNYKSHVEDLKRRMGKETLASISLGAVKVLRKQLSSSLAARTVQSRLGVLRLILIDAREDGLIDSTPFDSPSRTRRTKKGTAATSTRRITFQPYSFEELAALAKVLRQPRTPDERRFFPLTEALLYTGLRWAEPAAWVWPDLSIAGGRIEVLRTLPKHGVIRLEEFTSLEKVNEAFPPKTGTSWGITVRRPLRELLLRQRQVSYLGRENGWVFPNSRKGHLHYPNWLRRGWEPALRRAGVSPRAGDAQKSLRRTYVVSSLVCGRNPKEISAEVGHTTSRMVLGVYDAFLDASGWPADHERRKLAAFYGWPDPTVLAREDAEEQQG